MAASKVVQAARRMVAKRIKTTGSALDRAFTSNNVDDTIRISTELVELLSRQRKLGGAPRAKLKVVLFKGKRRG